MTESQLCQYCGTWVWTYGTPGSHHQCSTAKTVTYATATPVVTQPDAKPLFVSREALDAAVAAERQAILNLLSDMTRPGGKNPPSDSFEEGWEDCLEIATAKIVMRGNP